ncbi:hypothetical protein [Helicobacter canis]|uniref:hypothetical protein n=1 Tax=Helicobacter canis TaxID=29419 RepID=UPI000E0FABDE|nr:hypothetical protein [Helicobacter canis]
MLKTFRAKMIFTLIVFFVVGVLGLIALLQSNFNKLAKKESTHTVNMLSKSIFYTIRAGMNIGSREAIEASVQDSKSIQVSKMSRSIKLQAWWSSLPYRSRLSPQKSCARSLMARSQC